MNSELADLSVVFGNGFEDFLVRVVFFCNDDSVDVCRIVCECLQVNDDVFPRCFKLDGRIAPSDVNSDHEKNEDDE